MYVAAPCDASSCCRATSMHYSLIPFGATAAQPSPHFHFALSRGSRVLVPCIAVGISWVSIYRIYGSCQYYFPSGSGHASYLTHLLLHVEILEVKRDHGTCLATVVRCNNAHVDESMYIRNRFDH